MTSFADLIVVTLFATGIVTAPRAATADSAWTAGVAAAIAQRWSVPAHDVRLDWSHTAPADLPAAAAPFRLLGGADGWFVLSIGEEDGNPRALRVRAGLDEPVWVAVHDLARGARLQSGELRREVRLRWGSAGAGGGTPSMEGWTLRRPVAAGGIVDRPSANAPEVIVAGQHVELWWQRGDVAVRIAGVALHGARLGEAVHVRVEGRPRPLTGIVDAPGRARMGGTEAS